jgi:DNA-directed RNA polymerase specialized sigma subunit
MSDVLSAFYWRENLGIARKVETVQVGRRYGDRLPEFKARVVELRNSGLTQREVAERLGISRRYVQLIEASLYGEGRQ